MVMTLNQWLATEAKYVLGAKGIHWLIQEVFVPDPGFGALKLKVGDTWDFPIDWSEVYQRYSKYHKAALKAAQEASTGALIAKLEPAMDAMVAEARQAHAGPAARPRPNNNY